MSFSGTSKSEHSFIEKFVSAGKIMEQEAAIFRFVVAESHKAKDSGANLDELAIIETQNIANAVNLSFQ